MINFSYEKCELCPRNCKADRLKSVGYCKCTADAVVAKTMLHEWEEPCISSGSGSGAIFFSGCNLGCNYCQNGSISHALKGEKYDEKGLASLMLSLQLRGAANINLVTPTPYSVSIVGAVKLARSEGLRLPVVYNTSGYEKWEVIEMLKGTVDVWLTDFKYYSDELSEKYSKAKDYRERAIEAIDKMVELTGGEIVINENGVMEKGIIIRHLLLPGHINDTERVLEVVAERWRGKVLLSLMRQYTPDFAEEGCDLKRRLTSYEYGKAVKRAIELRLDGYTQEKESADKKFTPEF